MAQALPTLIIGVGGTGVRILQIVKERLRETYYGEVPSAVTLLAFDVEHQASDLGVYGSPLAPTEFELLPWHPGLVEAAMQEAAQGAKRWDWLDVDQLRSHQPPGGEPDWSFLKGTRLGGRIAVFMHYARIERRLQEAVKRLLVKLDPDEETQGFTNRSLFEAQELNRAPLNVFVVGSLTGGMGGGGMLDIGMMLHTLNASEIALYRLHPIGVFTLPSSFDTNERHQANNYAALRELDRFMIARNLCTDRDGGKKVLKRPFGLCYLIDESGNDKTILPTGIALNTLITAADFLVSNTDQSFGLRTLNNNRCDRVLYMVCSPYSPYSWMYDYTPIRPYSAFHCHTIIFPREDVARSLSYRFLLEFIDTHLVAQNQHGQPLVPSDPVSIGDVLAYLGDGNPSTEVRQRVELEVYGDPMDMGVFIRFLLTKQNAHYNTDAESVMKWLVEDGEQRRDALQTIQRSIDLTTQPPADAKDMNAYLTKGRGWLDTYLGPLVDPNNAFGDRSGGEWEKVSSQLIDLQRPQLEAYMQNLVLRILNQREDKHVGDEWTYFLRANRIGYALGILRALKEATRKFIEQTDLSFGDAQRNLIQLRRDLEEQKSNLAKKPGWFSNPGPIYLNKLKEVAKAERQRLLRNLTVAMANAFGGDLAEQGRSRSVLDWAINALEAQVSDLIQGRERIAQAQDCYEAQRRQKYSLPSRTYTTDPQRFPKAPAVEEGIYARYRPIIWRTLLGPDPMGAHGPAFFWSEATDAPFHYKIVTKHKNFKLHPKQPSANHPIFAENSGPEAIAQSWMEGGFRLMAEHIRNNKYAHVAAYIKELYRDQADLINRSLIPNGHIHTPLDGVVPSRYRKDEEHFLAVNYTTDDWAVSDFYQYFATNWHGFCYAESEVACMFVTLHHGLALDYFQGFSASAAAYRTMTHAPDRLHKLHLFPEERHAATYEAELAKQQTSQRRLHPSVVAGLGDPQKVQSFALALVSGLIREVVDTEGTSDLFLLLEGQPAYRLSQHDGKQPDTPAKVAYLRCVQILQAFETYILLGHTLNNEQESVALDYRLVDQALAHWINQQATSEQATWQHEPGELLTLLLSAKDMLPPAFDLGRVLRIELDRCQKVLTINRTSVP